MADTSSLYCRDLNERPLWALGGGAAVAAVFVGLGFRTHALVMLAAVPCFLLGVLAFLRVTTYLSVSPGVVIARSRLGQRKYEASDLTLELRGTESLFVLSHREKSRDVVCVFTDQDVDETQDAFRAAGVAVDA